MFHQRAILALTIAACLGADPFSTAVAEEPVVKFVSVPDFLNMDFQRNDPRLMDLTAARQAQLAAEIAAGGPQSLINPHVGNFVGTVENGYRGASQVLLEALAAENADFFTVSGDMLYTRWPKGTQLAAPGAADHIRQQADVYYDAWIDNVVEYSGYGLDDIYTIVGDHEIGDNNWGANKRPLIPTYREVYVDKLGNEATVAAGAYVDAPLGFEGRTYAVQRGNMLLVGLDQFETFTSASGGTYTNVASQIASVRVDVTGYQLAWLDATLAKANDDPAIEHIVVMGHAPVAGRDSVKVQATSSGLLNLTGEGGPLWQTLANHNVDLYLPGEVHAISMQQAYGVMQVVTGTNIFQPTNQVGVANMGFNLSSPVVSEQNYLVVEMYHDRIELTLKQIETAIWGNHGYVNDPLNDELYKNRETRVSIENALAGFDVVGRMTIDSSGSKPVFRNRSGLFLSEWTFGAPINIDLNGDGGVDQLDAFQFMAGQQMNLAGMTAEQAFAMGDLTGDFRNDYADFRIFKSAFDVNNGEGAFVASLAVPEPTTLALTLLGIVTTLAGRRRRTSSVPRRNTSQPKSIPRIAPR